jgi:hypothetical protein
MTMLKVSYRFEGTSLAEFRDALIERIKVQRELIPDGTSGTRVYKAKYNGERVAFDFVIGMLEATEFVIDE